MSQLDQEKRYIACLNGEGSGGRLALMIVVRSKDGGSIG